MILKCVLTNCEGEFVEQAAGVAIRNQRLPFVASTIPLTFMRTLSVRLSLKMAAGSWQGWQRWSASHRSWGACDEVAGRERDAKDFSRVERSQGGGCVEPVYE